MPLRKTREAPTLIEINAEIRRLKAESGLTGHDLNRLCRGRRIYGTNGYRKRRQLLIFSGVFENA